MVYSEKLLALRLIYATTTRTPARNQCDKCSGQS